MVSEKMWMLTSIFLFILLMFLFANQYNAQITGKPLETKETVRLDFFAMSMCNHCVKFEPVIRDVMNLLRDNVRFRVYYVAFDREDGFWSMHGEREIEENIRQLCVFEYYPDRFFDYVLCMGEDIERVQDNWERCSEANGIDEEVVRECWQGGEGEILFSENINKREYLGIKESPVLMINKQKYTGKRTKEALKDWICDKFENPPEECMIDLTERSLTAAIIGTPIEGTCKPEL